jgi:S1-C subfamily serine protease
MQQSDSESDGDPEQPRQHNDPWPPGEPVDGDQDTIAYGTPAADAGGSGQNRPAPGGRGEQVWYAGEPGHESYRDQPGYRAGGSGQAGWAHPEPPPPRRSRAGGRLLVYLTVGALAAGIGAGLTAAFGGSGTSSPPAISASDIPGPGSNAAGSGSSAAILNQAAVERKVERGLVDITATLRYEGEAAEGTGMILSTSGLVLTNNHVIDGATSVSVALVGTRQPYQARVIGYDDTADVALLQLVRKGSAAALSTVSFGNSSQVSLGTPVLALGNAEGRGGATATEGIISGLNRSIQASDEGSDTTEDLSNMLQTNARIQQGDSGGALANNAGQVIGMITAADTTPGQPGQPGGTTGFAIPIDTALAIARQIAGGHASPTVYIGTPGFLGVVVAQSDSPNPQQQAADARQSGNGQGPGGQGPGGGPGAGCLNGGEQPAAPAAIAPASSGALVLGILCGTPADTRGLAPGDVITSIDGQPVRTPNSLTAITARYHPGTVVTVGWLGIGGARHTTPITLSSGPAR